MLIESVADNSTLKLFLLTSCHLVNKHKIICPCLQLILVNIIYFFYCLSCMLKWDSSQENSLKLFLAIGSEFLHYVDYKSVFSILQNIAYCLTSSLTSNTKSTYFNLRNMSK